MSLERLLAPVSDALPCGPDLEAADDGDFIDYYFGAIDRLPESYVNSATGEVFDRRTIKVSDERKVIDKLLERTRDLRLLAIGAQFAALGGRIDAVADYVDLMAGLLETHWDHVHPRIRDGDSVDRCNALELLDTPATMVLPLEYAPILQDRRLDYISFRRYAVSSGQRSPREGERTEDASALVSALGSAENAEAADAAHASIMRLGEALRRIETVCRAAGSEAFSPNLGRIRPMVDSLAALMATARPDLSGAGAGEADADEAPEAGDEGFAAPGPAAAPAAVAVAGSIRDHAHARVALTAVERYFVQREPSSPALLLVRQSVELIGMPLVQALQVLLPERAVKARIDFGSDSGFIMGMDRMQALSVVAPAEAASPFDEAAETPEVVVTSREQAASVMSAVESFFRTTEPSSPIPTLLFKSKTYLSRDFTALLTELFPKS